MKKSDYGWDIQEEFWQKIIETSEMKNPITQTEPYSENIANELDQTDKKKKVRDGEHDWEAALFKHQ